MGQNKTSDKQMTLDKNELFSTTFFNLLDLPSWQSCACRLTQVLLLSFRPVPGFSSSCCYTDLVEAEITKPWDCLVTVWLRYGDKPSPCPFTVNWINELWGTEGSLSLSSVTIQVPAWHKYCSRGWTVLKTLVFFPPEGQRLQSQWRTATVLSSARSICCSTM